MSDHKDLLAPIGGTPPPSTPPQSGQGQMPTLGGQQTPPSAPRSGPAPLGGVGGGTTPGVFSPPVAPPVAPPPGTFNPNTFGPGASSGSTYRPPVVEEETGSNTGKIRTIVFTSLAVSLAACAYFVLRTPPPVPAPTSFTEFTSADNKFTVDTPNGWVNTPSGEASGDTNSVRFNGITMARGSTQIEVSMSTIAALMSSQLVFGSGPVPEAMTGSRSSGVNTLQKKGFQSRYKNYEEHMVPTPQTKMGGIVIDEGTKKTRIDGILYEWTADGNRFGLGGKKHGYRGAFAGTELIASVTCECAERDWPKLKPAFDRVMTSVAEINPKSKNLSLPGAGSVPMPTGP